MGVLMTQDIIELVGYLISSFGFGFISGALLRIFRRVVEKI